MARITLQGMEITQGRYPGDTGTGYSFLAEGEEAVTDDVSVATRGYYQGSRWAAVGDLDDRLELLETELGDVCAFPKAWFEADGTVLLPERGITSDECIAYGLLKVREG